MVQRRLVTALTVKLQQLGLEATYPQLHSPVSTEGGQQQGVRRASMHILK